MDKGLQEHRGTGARRHMGKGEQGRGGKIRTVHKIKGVLRAQGHKDKEVQGRMNKGEQGKWI